MCDDCDVYRHETSGSGTSASYYAGHKRAQVRAFLRLLQGRFGRKYAGSRDPGNNSCGNRIRFVAEHIRVEPDSAIASRHRKWRSDGGLLEWNVCEYCTSLSAESQHIGWCSFDPNIPVG